MVKILVGNNKGGSGKTAMAVNLTYALRELKAKVLFLDCDYESWCGVNWLTKDTYNIPVKMGELSKLRIPQDIDVVIFDGLPKITGFEKQYEELMAFADYMLIPVDGRMAVNPGATTTIEFWEKIKGPSKRIKTAIVLNKQKHMSRLPTELRLEIFDFVPGVPILGTVIPEGQVSWEEALKRHRAVWSVVGPKYRLMFQLVLKELNALWSLGW